MEMLKRLLEEKGGDWIRMLVEKTGMQPAQAEAFVPAAVDAVTQLLQGGKLDLSSLLGGDMGGLLSKLDLGGLAGAAGVDEPTARTGVLQLGPEIVGTLQENAGAGGLGDLLGTLSGSNASGDLLGKAGSLTKKLFG